MNGTCVDPEWPGGDIRIVDGFGMHQKECGGGVADEDAFADIHLRAGIEAGAVAHSELPDGGYGGGNKRNSLCYAVNYVGGFFDVVYVGGVEDDAINAFFENFGHKLCVPAGLDLDHNIFAAAGDEVLDWDNGPVEHTEDDGFLLRDGGGLVLVGLVGDVDEFNIFAGDDVAVFFDGFYFAEFAYGFGFAVG